MVPITARTRENYECWIVVINGEMVKQRMYAFPEGQIIVQLEFQNKNLEVQQDEALGAAWMVKCVRDEGHNVQEIKKDENHSRQHSIIAGPGGTPQDVFLV